jgi:starch-binding outer membrane protein, SusD/RagB family
MFVSQSCTDLEETLYSDLAAASFFRNDDEFIASLGQAYSSFGGLGNHSGLWTVQELASDELVVTTKGGDWYDGGVLIQLHKHEYTIDNPFFNNTWGFLYGGVNTSNRLIYQFQQLAISDPSKATLADTFVAELRAARALWYYWLLDSFGNVPLVTDFTNTEPPASTTRAAIYQFIETELNAVLAKLPTAKDQSTYGRMTRWAAQAVLCKLYLNAQVYTGTAQWQKAADAAADIINNGPFSLEGVYSNNFSISNAGSAENIFVYPYDKVFAEGFNWPMMTLHYASQGVYKLTAQPWNGYSAVEDFYNSYTDPVSNPGPQGPVWKGLTKDLNGDGVSDDIGTIDSRLSNFVVGPQYNPDGSRATDPGFETTGRKDAEGNPLPSDPDGAPLTFTPTVNQIYPNGLRQAGARIGKYQYEIGGTNNMSNDFVVFRLGDIILSRAEALWRLNSGSAEALSLVNQIRARAGVTAYVTLTADNLLAERGREMFAEMTRRQDLIRFGKFNLAWWEKGVSDPHFNLFPIPKAQRDVNSKLSQNPGYN